MNYDPAGKPRVAKDDIKDALRQLGVAEGDALFAHSSLSAFGYVEGGADAVVDALLETVGEGGTVALPTFTWGAFHAQERVVFDVKRTPSDCGRITEVFRKRPGAMRSAHVCHSVAAIGPRAEKIMGEGVKSFGEGSSLHRLYRMNSWYLLLGVGFKSCTALHTVEEMAQVPYRQYRGFEGSTVVLADGSEAPCRCVEYLRLPGYRNDFNRVEPLLAEAGVLRERRVGAARIVNARMREIVDTVMARVEQDAGFLLDDESRARLASEMLGRQMP